MFLERHGDVLDSGELRDFEPLRSDYEVSWSEQLQQCVVPQNQRTPCLTARDALQVDFYLRQIATEKGQQPAAGLTPQVRNRRLAKLNRLVEEGELSGRRLLSPWSSISFLLYCDELCR